RPVRGDRPGLSGCRLRKVPRAPGLPTLVAGGPATPESRRLTARPGPGDEEVVMTDVATPPGLSVWEADLFRHLTDHMEQEGALLASYKALAEASDADHWRYLVELIIEDEIRHHRLFTELVNAIRSAVERTDGLAVPMVRNAANPE